MRRLLVATANEGKQREFDRLLAHLPAEVVTPQAIGLELEVEEPFETYAANATAKARAYAAASGVLTVADDSGLEVAGLGWGPGVRTGRHGGPAVADRVRYLLEELGPNGDRRARMICWLAIGIPSPAVPDGAEPSVELFDGRLDGSVAHERRGEGGFGFDPIFLLPSGLTTAQLPDVEKDRISHRGRAVTAATPRLLELLRT